MVTKKTTTKKDATKPAKDKKAKVKLEPEKKEIKQAELLETTQPQEEEKTTTVVSEKYYEAIGRRKEATARVRLFTKKSTDQQTDETKALISVNNKPYQEYFPTTRLQNIVDSPLKKLKSANRFKVTVKTSGGGMTGQADAIKFGIARTLVLFDLNFSKKLRKAGYLTRDAREKERRKYGLKKARKAPQWAKR